MISTRPSLYHRQLFFTPMIPTFQSVKSSQTVTSWTSMFESSSPSQLSAHLVCFSASQALPSDKSPLDLYSWGALEWGPPLHQIIPLWVRATSAEPKRWKRGGWLQRMQQHWPQNTWARAEPVVHGQLLSFSQYPPAEWTMAKQASLTQKSLLKASEASLTLTTAVSRRGLGPTTALLLSVPTCTKDYG